MFFNNDLIFVVGSFIFVAGGVILTYSFYSGPTINKGESVVNISNIETNNLQYTDVSVQTINTIEATTTYVNTGMQTSARMWLESIRNWITEILGTTSNTQYVDVGVQTNNPSVWGTIKQWFLETFSVRSSELSSLGHNKVAKWRNKLDPDQSVDLNNSESTLTKITFHNPNDSTLDRLVDPDDSASQVSEVVSEANLQNVETANRVYDMSNPADVLDLMNDPTVVFSVNPAALPGDDLITFYTADSANEILRSTLEALLTSVK